MAARCAVAVAQRSLQMMPFAEVDKVLLLNRRILPAQTQTQKLCGCIYSGLGSTRQNSVRSEAAAHTSLEPFEDQEVQLVQPKPRSDYSKDHTFDAT